MYLHTNFMFNCLTSKFGTSSKVLSSVQRDSCANHNVKGVAGPRTPSTTRVIPDYIIADNRAFLPGLLYPILG